MYYLNETFITSLGQKFIAFNAIRRPSQDISGTDWEEIFSECIGAKWRPSNTGLDDIVFHPYAHSAKTVKQHKPFNTTLVRLISGRISGASVNGTRSNDPQYIGDAVLKVWNERVASVAVKYETISTVVLVRDYTLNQFMFFETGTNQYEPWAYLWHWNKRNNLEAVTVNGDHAFTWQPSGGQFTICQPVPSNTLQLVLPTPPKVSEADILKAVSFTGDWIQVKQMPHDTLIRSQLFAPFMPAQLGFFDEVKSCEN